MEQHGPIGFGQVWSCDQSIEAVRYPAFHMAPFLDAMSQPIIALSSFRFTAMTHATSCVALGVVL